MFPLSWVWWLACLVKILVKSDTSRARFWPFKPIKTGLKLARLPLRFPHSCGHGCRVKTDRCDSDWRTDGRSPKPPVFRWGRALKSWYFGGVFLKFSFTNAISCSGRGCFCLFYIELGWYAKTAVSWFAPGSSVEITVPGLRCFLSLS